MRYHRLTWAEVARYLTQPGAPTYVRVAKSQAEHPAAAGLVPSLGLPVGQLADWRGAPPSCHGLHVREFLVHYTAHVDRVNPHCDLPGHLAADTPALGGGAALGALVGLIVGESPGAMLIGALIGGALGASASGANERALTSGGRSYLGGVITTGTRTPPYGRGGR